MVAPLRRRLGAFGGALVLTTFRVCTSFSENLMRIRKRTGLLDPPFLGERRLARCERQNGSGMGTSVGMRGDVAQRSVLM